MNTAVAAALSGLALLFPHATQTHDLGSGWLLSVKPHAFAASATCSLHNRRVQYLRRALVFGFARRTNTLNAVYRIDGGPPVRTREDQAAIALRGFALMADDLENPSGGKVRIPLERLSGADSVMIDPDRRDRPVTFHIAGLGAALERLQKWGCVDASFF